MFVRLRRKKYIMQRHSLFYKSSTISYIRFGNGNQLVICFHGFGESAESFALEAIDRSSFTFIAIDLPFHGHTNWQEPDGLTPTDLHTLLTTILATEKLRTNSFYLLGYSLGARVALHLYQQLYTSVSRLILLAPDGLKVNGWYWLATQTLLGKKLFSFTMKHPGWFFKLLQVLNKIGVVNSSIFKFVNYYISDATVREQLYQRWICLRKFKPSIPTIKKHIQQQETPVRLLYGKYDRIIVPARGEKFRKGIEAYCSLTIITAGHQLLGAKYTAEINKLLNDSGD